MNQKDNFTKDVSVLLNILDFLKNYNAYDDWKNSAEQLQKSEEIKTDYEKFIKEKYGIR